MKVKAVIPDYLNHLKMLGRSYYTVKNTRYGLRHFANFLEAENAVDIEDLSADILSEYQQELYFCLTAKAKPLTLRTQAQRLGADYIIRGIYHASPGQTEGKRLP